MLTKHQSGFRAYDNTTLQLVRLVDEWTKAMDKGEVVGCVFLDLRKAFDKVWHHGLLAKLAGYGIRGSLLEWFCSYLTDRRQRVVVNGATSDWKTPLAGVPQGSILGPTLFILYINDLPSRCTTCEANLFADDTSLTVAHRSINTVVDSLNTDLATVSEWLQHWKLEANRDKCKVMFLTTRPLPQRIPPVILAGTTLQIVHSHKHLGVTLTSKLTWSAHVEAMTNKARRTAGMLCALRKKVPKTILLQLYKIIVRPVLEYADIVWGGLTMRDQKTIESVQYRSARVISGHHGIPYPSHKSLYSQFALPSLTYRRKVHAVTTLYKLKNGHCPPHLASLLPVTRTSAIHSRYPLRNGNNLCVQIPKSSRTQNAFLHRATLLWNSLSVDIQSAPTLFSFKAKARKSFGDPYST
ncbi:hypothetical protein Bbelb_228540 [Branchiostoma belcheri]|nr:hypothetical protein Bbelb_228540 [Branchiostoma belcheri]